MKVKIKTYNGELPEYLTLGKDYELVELENYPKEPIGKILNDHGDIISIDTKLSVIHLNGGSWEILK